MKLCGYLKAGSIVVKWSKEVEIITGFMKREDGGNV